MRRLVLAWIVACGDGDLVAGDASTGEDATRELVRFRFSTAGTLAGHDVVFQNRDSSLVLATRTDSSGRANAFMDAGGYVSIVRHVEGATFIDTYAAVESRAELAVQDTLFLDGDHRIELRIPETANASTYQLVTDCNSQEVSIATSEPLSLRLIGCGSATPMLVYTSGSAPSYIYEGSVALTNPAVELAGPYVPITGTTVSVVNVPPTVDRLAIAHALVSGRRTLYSDPTLDVPTVMAGTAVANVSIPLPSSGTTRTVVSPPTADGQYVIDWRPAQLAPVIDYGAVTLPRYVEPPRYDASRHALVWAEDHRASPADVVLASFQWSTAGTAYRWRIASPRGDATELRLPVLPMEDLQPTGDVGVQYLVSLDVTGDEDVARTQLLGAWDPARPWPIRTASGRVVFRTGAR